MSPARSPRSRAAARTHLADSLRVAVKVVTLVCVSCALSGAAALSAALQHLGWTLFTSRLLSLVLHHLFTPTKLHSSHRDASCPQVRRALASGVPVPGDIAPRPRHGIGLLAVPWSRREQTRILVAPHTLAAGLSTWRTFASPVPLAVSLSWRFQLAAPLPRLAPVQRNSFITGTNTS